MPNKVTIIDYGIGNLFSISKALEAVGAEVLIATDSESVLNADRLILPGVGAFSAGMSGLKEQGLSNAVKEYAKSGKPLLGICLGMQMLMSSSEEHGDHQGLNIIPGRVRKIPNTTLEGEKHKIPHIGWNSLHSPSAEKNWSDTILEGTTPSDAVYFVHSYAVTTDKPEDALAVTYYGGHQICSVVNHGTVYGCQFHPEKSGEVGLNILKRFIEIKT